MTGQAALAVAVVWAFWAVWFASRVKQLKILVVIDGDTYDAINRRGKRIRLRLRGCDCPEPDQPHGPAARAAVQELMAGQWVSVRLHGKDRYRRQLASIKVDGQDLARVLLRRGLAYPLPGTFSPDAVAARFQGVGVWSSGIRAKPWEARSRRKGLLPWLVRAGGRNLKRWSRRRRRR